MMEKIIQKCIVCNGRFIKKFSTKNFTFECYRRGLDYEFDVYECRKCKLLMVLPLPSKKLLEKFYYEEYFDIKKGNIIESKLVDFINFIGRSFVFRFMEDIPILKKRVKNSLMLDVGCGTGSIMRAYKKTGWDCLGIDFSKHAIKKCKELGLKAREANIETLKTKGGKKYNLIVLSHVLEHLTNPKKTLVKLRKMLRQQGTLILATPNTNSFEFKLFSKYWYELDVPRHIYNFSTFNLKLLLSTTGFKIIKIFSSPLPHILMYLDFFVRGKKFCRFNKFTTILNYLIFLPIYAIISRLHLGSTVTIVAESI